MAPSKTRARSRDTGSLKGRLETTYVEPCPPHQGAEFYPGHDAKLLAGFEQRSDSIRHAFWEDHSGCSTEDGFRRKSGRGVRGLSRIPVKDFGGSLALMQDAQGRVLWGREIWAGAEICLHP